MVKPELYFPSSLLVDLESNCARDGLYVAHLDLIDPVHVANTCYIITTKPTDPRSHKARLPDSNDAPPLYTTSSLVYAFHPGN